MKSKKERLKEQSLKQIEMKKQAEREEEELKKSAENDDSLSLSSVKLMKKEPIVCLVLKLLAVAVYLYSCLYYGGITVIGILNGYVNNVENKYAYYMLAGIVILLASLLLMFFKKYIVSAILNAAGTILYMKTAVFLVEKVRKLLEDNYVTDADVKVLDKTYMLRHYPELAFLALGLILLLINIIRRYLKYRRIKAIRDNAPVKSIIDD